MSETTVICVVEDDPDMRMLIRAMLRVDTRLVVNGEAGSIDDAIAVVRDQEPDLIILDHFINGEIMGLEGAPLLKAAAPGAQILLFTSHELTIEVEREPAVNGYLKKGSIEDLLSTIQRMLGLDGAGLDDL